MMSVAKLGEGPKTQIGFHDVDTCSQTMPFVVLSRSYQYN